MLFRSHRVRHLIDRLTQQLRSEFVDERLYSADHGFYELGGQAGRARGDFVTSVEVGPLFSVLIGRWLDLVWADLGEPAPFIVAEAGAGRGALAAGVLAARPRCSAALRYLTIERSAALRASQQELLDELRRQREYYESLSGPSWQSELPGQAPRAESVRPPIPTERPTAQAQPVKSSRAARAKPSLTQRSKESAKLNASRLEARSSRLERFAERTLQRRLPEYIKVHRPDLRHDVRDELASGDGPLHHLARRIDADWQRVQRRWRQPCGRDQSRRCDSLG